MEYKFTSLPKSEVEIQVTLPLAEFEPHLKRATEELAAEITMAGFRKGKAPLEMVKKEIGEGAIYEQAAELAVRKSYPELLVELIEKGEIRKETPPIGRPEVTILKLAPGNEFQYRVRVALLPQVILSPYRESAKRLRKERKNTEVTEKEVTDSLEWIRESRAPLVTVDRGAKTGDRVEVDFEVSHGGVKIEHGASQNHPLVLGQGRFLPGFEEQLLGMKAGEEKKFSLLAPSDWHDQNLSGKNLDFKTSMKLVQERQKAELNDEFAQNLGNFASLEELKKNIRAGITKEKEEKEKQRIRSVLAEEIAGATKADIPEVLIVSELEKMTGELKTGVQNMGMKWEDYLLHVKKSEAELKKDWEKEAEKRVKAALALRAIAEQEKIGVSEEEIETRANEFLKQYGSPEEAAKTIDPGELREYTRGVIRNEKVFEFLENL